MSECELFQNVIEYRYAHTVTAASLYRALVLSAAQQESFIGGVIVDDAKTEMTAWTPERVGAEMVCHFHDYGEDMRPGWAGKIAERHHELAKLVAPKVKTLIGGSIDVEISFEHFGMLHIVQSCLEEALELRRGYDGEPVTERIEGVRFVRIPKREFGFAEEPADRLKFDHRLREIVEMMTRPKLDDVVLRRARESGPYRSGRTLHVAPIEQAAEKLVQDLYPEIARCTSLGYFYVRQSDTRETFFCNNVCDAHRMGREPLLGERPHFNDGSDDHPRRCSFSRSIPFLERGK